MHQTCSAWVIPTLWICKQRVYFESLSQHACVDLSPTENKQSGMYHFCSTHQMNGYPDLNSQNSTSLDSSMKAGIQLYDYLLHWYLATRNTSSLLQDKMTVRSSITLLDSSMSQLQISWCMYMNVSRHTRHAFSRDQSSSRDHQFIFSIAWCSIWIQYSDNVLFSDEYTTLILYVHTVCVACKSFIATLEITWGIMVTHSEMMNHRKWKANVDGKQTWVTGSIWWSSNHWAMMPDKYQPHIPLITLVS